MELDSSSSSSASSSSSSSSILLDDGSSYDFSPSLIIGRHSPTGGSRGGEQAGRKGEGSSRFFAERILRDEDMKRQFTLYRRRWNRHPSSTSTSDHPLLFSFPKTSPGSTALQPLGSTKPFTTTTTTTTTTSSTSLGGLQNPIQNSFSGGHYWRPNTTKKENNLLYSSSDNLLYSSFPTRSTCRGSTGSFDILTPPGYPPSSRRRTQSNTAWDDKSTHHDDDDDSGFDSLLLSPSHFLLHSGRLSNNRNARTRGPRRCFTPGERRRTWEEDITTASRQEDKRNPLMHNYQGLKKWATTTELPPPTGSVQFTRPPHKPIQHTSPTLHRLRMRVGTKSADEGKRNEVVTRSKVPTPQEEEREEGFISEHSDDDQIRLTDSFSLAASGFPSLLGVKTWRDVLCSAPAGEQAKRFEDVTMDLDNFRRIVQQFKQDEARAVEQSKLRDLEAQEGVAESLRRLSLEKARLTASGVDRVSRMHCSFEDLERGRQLVESLLSPGGVLCEKQGIEITSRIMSCLSRGRWLDDEIINMYMILLQERNERQRKNAEDVPSCCFLNTFFYERLKSGDKAYDYNSVRRWTRKKDVFACDLLILPVHYGKVHWTLGVIDMRERRIKYYDSMNNGFESFYTNMIRYLMDEHVDKKKAPLPCASEWTYNAGGAAMRGVPQQENGYDCGVFMCQFAECIADNRPIDFTQAHMDDIRRKMAVQIVDQCID